MRDNAGKFLETLFLLTQFMFAFFPIGDILDRAADTLTRSVHKLRFATGSNPLLDAIGGSNPDFNIVVVADFESSSGSRMNGVSVIRVIEPLDIPLRAGVVLRVNAVNLIDLVAEIYVFFYRVILPCADIGEVLCFTEQIALSFQGVLCARVLNGGGDTITEVFELFSPRLLLHVICDSC